MHAAVEFLSTGSITQLCPVNLMDFTVAKSIRSTMDPQLCKFLSFADLHPESWRGHSYRAAKNTAFARESGAWLQLLLFVQALQTGICVCPGVSTALVVIPNSWQVCPNCLKEENVGFGAVCTTFKTQLASMRAAFEHVRPVLCI